MKRIISVLMCALICVCALTSCSGEDGFSDSEALFRSYTRSENTDKTYNFEDGAAEPPASYNTYSELITAYCLKLFRSELADSGEESSCRSPLGAALMLSQLSGGMKGDALSELQLALGNGLDSDTLNTCSSYLKSRLESVSRMYSGSETSLESEENGNGSYVNLDSYLLVNSDKDILSAFLQANADYYGSEVYRLDFSSDSSEEKLQALLGEGFPGCSGDMTAVFGTSLSDSWLAPYTAESEVKGEFRKADGGTEEKTFLCSGMNSLSSKKAQAVLSYTAKTPLKVMFIMPNEDISLGDYLKTFDSAEYFSLLESFSVTERKFAEIPQFSVKSPEVTKLNGALEKSGLHLLFSEDAKFPKLAHNDISLTDFYELGAKLDFSASGIGAARSSAAAVSPVGEASGDDSSELEVLRFDRPFVCVVFDNESNIPVLIGTVYD